jgi:nucleotide-binding universal stress UspA family protein
MDSCFATIIIPVDFSTETDAAIEKALELSTGRSTIHLLYIQGHTAIPRASRAASLLKGLSYFEQQDKCFGTKLLQLKSKIKGSNAEVQVVLKIVRDVDAKQVIINEIEKLSADLIVIGKNYKRTYLSLLFNQTLPVSLVRKAPCTVLTVSSRALSEAMRVVIVPLVENAACAEMGIMATFSNSNRLNIHLVTFAGHGANLFDSAPSPVLRAYQWLKTSLRCQVQCKVLPARNKAKAMLKYAEAVNADVVLVDASIRQKSSWFGGYVTSLLQPRSEISVLAVQPLEPYSFN